MYQVNKTTAPINRFQRKKENMLERHFLPLTISLHENLSGFLWKRKKVWHDLVSPRAGFKNNSLAIHAQAYKSPEGLADAPWVVWLTPSASNQRWQMALARRVPVALGKLTVPTQLLINPLLLLCVLFLSICSQGARLVEWVITPGANRMQQICRSYTKCSFPQFAHSNLWVVIALKTHPGLLKDPPEGVIYMCGLTFICI